MSATGVQYSNLGTLRQALAEAARTDESNAEKAIARFVELRPGIQDTLSARRHHLLSGRRGTGKSTLLHVVRQRLRQQGAPVAVIDMERFKGRAYPDVLIEIVIALLDEVKPRVRPKHVLRDLRLRRRFNRSRAELQSILDDPQSMTKKVQRGRHTVRRGLIRGRVAGGRGPISVDAGGEASSGTARSTMSTAEFEELKIERLQQVAAKLSVELTDLVKGASNDQAIIFIDDFYYVRLGQQPDVLDYLQQVVKSAGIWLKVGGVGARMRTFRDGNPPVGMQLNQDIDLLTIDVTLNDFGTAKRFLERMLDGVLKPTGLTTSQLFTETARSRMVLACGGAVARDYVTLTSAALDAAIERLSKKAAPTSSTIVNIQTEDVSRAARERLNRKEDEELNQDAGPDATPLKARWRDICDFIRNQGNTSFVLIRQQDLDEAEWGSEIYQLENLRLLHRIKDTVPNAPNWRGVKTMVFMVDLGQVTGARLRKEIPTFWVGTSEFDKLRRAEWVYGPEWRKRLRDVSPVKRPIETADDTDIPVLFDDPSELD